MRGRFQPGRSAEGWAVYDKKGFQAPIMTRTRELARKIANDLNREEREHVQTSTSSAA